VTATGCEERQHAASPKTSETASWRVALRVLFPSVPRELTGVAHGSLELTDEKGSRDELES
jgi:hypothetical protein